MLHRHHGRQVSRHHQRKSGFSLVELLVTIAIIAILVALGSGAYQGALAKGAMAREMAAGKNLIAAYLVAAADNNGRFLPGYDRTITDLTLPDGTMVSGPPAQRYPFRLASYFGYRMEGVILVNDNAKQIASSDAYQVSCFPAFGMNYIFVGGDVSSSGVYTFPNDCVTTQGAAASSLLVFATAADSNTTATSGSDKIKGYCILTPPRETGPMWSTSAWSKTSRAGDYGNVDARFGGKAISVFLDGSIRLLSIDDLRDMRLWSRNAAALDQPNYSVTQSQPSGGRM